MSETAPEIPAGGSRPAGGGKLGVWSKKMGPMPLWAWVAIGLLLVIGIMYYKNRNSSGSSGSSNSTAAAGTAGAGQVPQFVNQTYTTVTPPDAPAATSTPAPVPDEGTHQEYRDVADGRQSLAQVAKSRHTTVQGLIATTKAAATTGGITPENLARFLEYVKGGTNKPMPKGLVFYTANPNASSKGGVSVPNG